LFFYHYNYLEQLEQLWLVQSLQPEEEAVIFPPASLEQKENAEISFFSLLPLHFGQETESELALIK